MKLAIAGDSAGAGLAHSLAEGRGGEEAADALAALFDDESEDVRNTAAAVFRRDELFGRPLAVALTEAFARSRAFAGNTDDLLWGLDRFGGSLQPYAAAVTAIVGRPAAPTARYRYRMPIGRLVPPISSLARAQHRGRLRE